jgi:hypothetical protein
VLWYPEMRTSGGSASVALALGSRRPVFVNDVQAFGDLPERTKNLRKVASAEELETALREQLVDDFAEARSWDRVAAFIVDAYHEALAARDGARGRRGAPLRARLYAALDHKPIARVRHRLSPLR